MVGRGGEGGDKNIWGMFSIVVKHDFCGAEPRHLQWNWNRSVWAVAIPNVNQSLTLQNGSNGITEYLKRLE
jgi:hypothetical protein